MRKTPVLGLVVAVFGIAVAIATVGWYLNFAGPFLKNKEGVSDMKWKYAYDDRGRVIEMTSPADRKVSFTYDDDPKTGITRRITRRDGDEKTVVFEMDGSGRCIAMSDGVGSTRYGYDESGRLTSAQRDGRPKVTYTYDEMNKVRSLSVGEKNAMKVSYVYDFLGRLSTMTTPAGNITYQYQPGEGRVIRTLPNSIRTVFDHRPDGRLKAITHVAADNKVLSRFSYSYRPDGLIQQVVEWAPTGERKIDYSYDEVQRLISVNDSQAGKTEFRYDKLGNRLALKVGGKESDSFAYDWSGKITHRREKACSHDGAGNLTSYGGDQATPRFEYDPMGTLKTATKNGGVVSYQYDGEGRLLSRKEQDRETRFLADYMGQSWRPLLMQSTGGTDTFFVWNGDTPLVSISGKEVRFLLGDHLGSVRAVVDQRGAVISQYAYDAFGSPHQPIAPEGLHPGFAGLFYDPTAGLYLTQARAYDPQTGRFLQIDPQFRIPKGSQKDLSWYVYCGNDPVNYVDRDGAEARETVTFNPVEHWLDAFFRTLLYNSNEAKLLRLFVHNPTPLAINTDPDARDSVISQIVANAMSKTNQDSTAAWQMVKNWREHENQRPPEFARYNETIKAYTTWITDQEWKCAENYMYARKCVETGECIVPTQKGAIAAFTMKYFGFTYWEISHALGETIGIPPDAFIKLVNPAFGSGDDEWLPITDATRRWWDRAISDAYNSSKLIISPPPDQRAFDYYLNSGTRVLGTSTSAMQYEYSNGLLSRMTRSEAHYTETHDGAALSKAVERWNQTGIWECPAKAGNTSETRKSNYPSRQAAVKMEKPKPNDERRLKPLNDKKPAIFGGGDDGGPDGSAGGGHWRDDGRWGGRGSGGGGGVGSGFFRSAGGGGFQRSATSPSNVGGVYLHGAGEALKKMGTISGIALDENGRLILLSEGRSPVGLPPLRMDDVVTVFKSVYHHGSPFVSIDPDPKNPEGPKMLVRHDEGTAGTYAGWVLFEADRVMKAYSLGSDNVTKAKLASAIPGYQSILDMGFSGAGTENRDPIWERFWIVPAEVKNYRAGSNRLSLFDIPLKVNTQRMVLKSGKLEPAVGKEPSAAVRKFTEWFTKNYDRIAQESRSNAAKEGGVQGSVAVFTELRRIALLTAIAESLRDQGVPLPAWMENYPAKSYPVPTTTPSITVKATRTDARSVTTQRIYGGVRLAPQDKDIRVIKGSKEVETLSAAVARRVASVPSLTPVAVDANGKTYQAIALPGDETGDLGGNQITEVDLTVPVQQGATISVARKFNSFFEPTDDFGKGWTLNLPFLKVVKQPVKRVGDQTQFQTVYQLTSPLGSYSELFKSIEFVPEVNGKIMVPQRRGSILGMADTTIKEIGAPTKEVLFRDGATWHFNSAGYLAAALDGPSMTIYRWDNSHRIVRIEGWYGRILRADIRIDYDKQGRMISAVGSNKEKVRYAYNSAGALQTVERPSGKAEYGYAGGLVTSVKQNGKEVRGYSYDTQGRLVQERQPKGVQTAFTYRGGQVVSTTGNATETSEYDSAMRPVKRRFADGTVVQWAYPAAGTAIATVQPANGAPYHVVSTNNGRHVDWVTADGYKWTTDYDSAGRVIGLQEGNHTIVQQQWHPNGLPGVATYPSFAARPQYSENGLLERILITPPGNQQQFKDWVEVGYNEAGLPAKVRDYTGAETSIGYDRNGQPSVVASKRGTIKVAYDGKGRMTSLVTDYGHGQVFAYDDKTGTVKGISFAADGKKAELSFNKGQLSTIGQFDGGKYKLDYDDDSNGTRLKSVVTPNKVKLKYDYDKDGRIERVNCDGTYTLKLTYDKRGRLTSLSQVPLH